MKEIIIINYDYLTYFVVYGGELYRLEDLDKNNLPFKSEVVDDFIHYDVVIDDVFTALGVDKINYIDCGDLYTYVRQ